jgi:small-conductance mechanosensitive channel
MDNVVSLIVGYKYSALITVLVLVLRIVLLKYVLIELEQHIGNSRLKAESHAKARRSVVLFANGLTILLIVMAWGFDFKGVVSMSLGLITLLGASLFASWSILSNVTAFFLLLFHKSFKRGNYIRVIVGDNYTEGYISEINMFNTRLITDDKEIIIFPNTMLVANPIVFNPRNHGTSIGKISAPPAISGEK